MKHLSEMRIMELALHDTLVLSPEESSHLHNCPSCMTTLDAERSLTQSLCSIPSPNVPSRLLLSTVSEFKRAHQRLYQLPMFIGSVLALLTGGFIVALIGFRHAEFITMLVEGIGDLFALGNVLLNLAARVPYAVQVIEMSLTACFFAGLASLLLGGWRSRVEITGDMKRTKG